MVLNREPKMRKIHFYLSKEQIAALRTIASHRGVSRSQVIRETLDRFIEAEVKVCRLQLMEAAFGIWADHPEFNQRRLRAEFDRPVES